MKTINNRHSERGSALVVAMLFCGALAIMLAGYLSVANQTAKLANRAYHMSAAMNVAETGLEEGIWAVNGLKTGTNPNAFDSWTKVGTANAKQRFTGFTMGQNSDGYVDVFVKNYAGGMSAPIISAHAVLTLPDGSTVDKWVQVSLKLRSYFSGTFVAKDKVVFNGNNASVDSWNSDPDRNATTAPIPYSAAVRNDRGSVGSISVEVDVVNIQNADIWGSVATGDSDPTTSVKNNGSIMGADSAAKDKTGWAKANVDPDRVSTDFTSNFDPVAVPTTTAYVLGQISSNTSLPRAGDLPASDGKYYYSASGIALAGKTDLLKVASGDVIIVLPGTYGISISGSTAGIEIANNASLDIYVAGDVSISGNGIANGTAATSGGALTTSTVQRPIHFKLWGTAADTDGDPTTTSQNIAVKGNGVLSGVIYAPNANLTINGNGDMCGSAIASKITVVGNAAFHYDESLRDSDNGNPYGLGNWRELLDRVETTAIVGEFSN